MAVKVLIVEDNPVARSFLCRVVRESFSDVIAITEAGDLEGARKQIALPVGARISGSSWTPDGAAVVYVVHGERGEVLLPARSEVIRAIDLTSATMTVELLPGL